MNAPKNGINSTNKDHNILCACFSSCLNINTKLKTTTINSVINSIIIIAG